MIDRPTIDRILDATNIVEVVSDFISLRKRGTSYKGLCPFHDDTTPSFSVSPSKGVYKCFACGKAGNAVNFVMEHEQISYVEALRWLAKKYHIEIHERELTDEERQQQSERESMIIVNEWAASYFHDILFHNTDGKAYGLQYFRHRGFSDETIAKFRLGYCLNSRDAMSQTALKKGYKTDYLIKTGLSYARNDNKNISNTGDDDHESKSKSTDKLFDRFNNRVIFPWINIAGKVVAFGGRLLDSRTKGVMQKYVNSPDSDIYHKDHELYGIFQAKKQIVKEDRVFMVEGYTDVISMHQCGIENVVANSGTALSFYQIKLLRRFTQNITLLYDGDEAGIHAALRGTDMLLSEGMNVKVLLLPDQEDPDSFAQKHTADDFKRYIDDHQVDFIRFKTDLLLKGETDPIKRSEAISNIVKSISVIKDPIIRASYIKDCSHQTGIAEQTLITQMNRFIRDELNRQHNITTTDTAIDANDESPDNPQQTAEVKPTAADLHFDRTNKERILQDAIERMIVQTVIRYGEKVIEKDVEFPGGEIKNVTVADYVYYDLKEDKLVLSLPIYQKIINEACQHVHDDGFRAETYFLHHKDNEIVTLATQLSVDDYNLSQRMQITYEEENLKNLVRHLILNYRKYHVEIELKALYKQLAQSRQEEDESMQILKQINKLQEHRNLYAKYLGNNIIN